ncbi:peroxide stress protein YaaA [Helicobacter sp. MIT 99-5507]|uniref:peroxide stress protein YaaA n=1 Tax=Helicobacter sp. MIT 99-5507 TaxID=152489 RepID=UPI000E1F72CB|nr:peroxide stress protein YaaA [Helicobacter sp. MIT 99-5507]RDU58477.1 peroxide stress protein YaaA [Helicobacter sp. MIT 99-5507]
MIILFSPSEDKKFIYKESKNKSFAFVDNLLFSDLNAHRLSILKKYINFLKKSPSGDLARIFGVKSFKNLDLIAACSSIDCANTIESIYLYSGTAFRALDIESMPKNGLDFVMNNVIIFSNLFGAIRAKDKIPYYKLKQGENFLDININYVYKGFDGFLDDYLKDKEILDLRAEFYTKAYKLNLAHTKVEFFKNGKKATHCSKFYRGLLLRNLAINNEITYPFKLISSKTSGLTKILQYEVLN